MSTLEQLKGQLGRVWESVAEGWQHLRARAADAVTHFTPVRGREAVETAGDLVALQSSRWALLAAEVRESEESVSVRIEIPGMDPDAFDISVVDGALVVAGEKQVERESRQGRYHLMECAYGRFERRVPLPVDVDPSRASARYRSGVLQVTLPKHGRYRARRVEVQSGG
jgi:HSP20 family protein